MSDLRSVTVTSEENQREHSLDEAFSDKLPA